MNYEVPSYDSLAELRLMLMKAWDNMMVKEGWVVSSFDWPTWSVHNRPYDYQIDGS